MYIVLFLLIEIAIGFFALGKTNPNDLFSISCIFITTIPVFAFINKNFPKHVTIVLIAYIVRIALLFASYYQLFPIIHDGADTETFNAIATINARKGYIEYSLTNYSVLLSFLYMIIGPQRLFAQYINLLLGMSAIYYVYQTFTLIKIYDETKKWFLTIVCFTPELIILSGILLRESLIIFSVSISVYLFVKWLFEKNVYCFIFSSGFILLAAWMHSGMIGMLLGYMMAFTLYKHETGKIVFSFRSSIAICLCIAFLMFLISIGVFTEYFDRLLESEDATAEFISQVNSETEGDSKYLTWINADSPTQAIVFSPLKMFYFLFSPIPFDWRGLRDLIAFCLDSSIIIYLFFTIFKGLKWIRQKKDKAIVKFLLTAILITAFIYGYGVFTAGTAMRHRTKIIPALIVMAAISYNHKHRDNLFNLNKNGR
jgi:hypothetical protein